MKNFRNLIISLYRLRLVEILLNESCRKRKLGLTSPVILILPFLNNVLVYFLFNPPLFAYAKLQPLLAPWAILTKLLSLLSRLVKMTNQFQLSWGLKSAVWRHNKNISYRFPETVFFFFCQMSMYFLHWKKWKNSYCYDENFMVVYCNIHRKLFSRTFIHTDRVYSGLSRANSCLKNKVRKWGKNRKMPENISKIY